MLWTYHFSSIFYYAYALGAYMFHLFEVNLVLRHGVSDLLVVWRD